MGVTRINLKVWIASRQSTRENIAVSMIIKHGALPRSRLLVIECRNRCVCHAKLRE